MTLHILQNEIIDWLILTFTISICRLHILDSTFEKRKHRLSNKIWRFRFNLYLCSRFLQKFIVTVFNRVLVYTTAVFY